MLTPETITLDHIDPRWEESREYQLTCGFHGSHPLAHLNEVPVSCSYNARKTNRFVPYRIGKYPAPLNEGDTCEFLIGADVKTDTPGEWIVCEFNVKDSVWWAESSRIGCGSTEGARVSLERGVGCHAPGMASKGSKNQPHEDKVKGGILSHELGLGVHSRTPEEMAEDGRKGGTTTAQRGLGFRSPGQASAGGRTVSSQRFQSTDPNHPPHVSSAAGLARWQMARGIDTTLRVKLAG
jgi:hypothetical protein